jgi:protein PhnA
MAKSGVYHRTEFCYKSVTFFFKMKGAAMQEYLACPRCAGTLVYFDGSLWVCPDCAHEWTSHSASAEAPATVGVGKITDAHGNILSDGDTVTVIKDLRIKGSSSSVKVGTKVKNIRLLESSDGHNIACKIDGFGGMNLKSEFVKKA